MCFGIVIDIDGFHSAQLLFKVELHRHIAGAEMLIYSVLVERSPGTYRIKLADDLCSTVDIDIIVGHPPEVHPLGRVLLKCVTVCVVIGNNGLVFL